MTVLKIDSFGGEIPRVPARQLPVGSAQISENLLATSNEFRPLQQAGSSVAQLTVTGTTTPLVGAKTLYRTQRRSSDNQLHASTAEGWRADAAHTNYVKGQLSDDSTERTYYTRNDGSIMPKVFDNSGSEYTLGIPRPPKPEVLIHIAPKLSQKDAVEWRDKTLIPLFARYVQESMVRDASSRFTPTLENGPITGGSTAGLRVNPSEGVNGAANFTNYPDADGASLRGIHEPWNMMAYWDKTLGFPEGLGSPALNTKEGTVNGIPSLIAGVYVFPSWGVLNRATLTTKLRTVMNPQHPARRLWTNWEVNWLVDSMAVITAPGNSAVSAHRDIIDNSARDYVRQGYNLFLQGNRPTQGEKSDEEYAIDLADWQAKQYAGVSAMVSAAEKCAAASEAIEKLYNDAFSGFANILGDWLRAGVPLTRTDSSWYGLVNPDDETIRETRFYVVTYVTEWGEESAPSEPSAQLDLAYNDLVTIKAPSTADIKLAGIPDRTVETGRNITKWRIYRSNSGTQGATFQFVAERKLTDTTNVTNPLVLETDTVGYAVTGAGDQDRWRDLVAVWRVYSARGDYAGTNPGAELDKFRDTKKLVIGDTVTQNNHKVITGDTPTQFHPPFTTEYTITKTWNGHAWVPQRVANPESVAGEKVYVDGLSGAQLGEVCPTVTWEPPPYRVDTADTYKDDRIRPPKGTNPYLRGLVGMANGVTAGFVDNFVAFSEPYVPSAWPVEYQIPLEFPIVGLCAFGQSLLVGTHANPYIISGSDSANMSAIKLNNSQACVSARSMVAAMGGVFYASPDGYCFASQNGVEVITAALFAREDWQKLKPETIFAAVHDNVLYFWARDADQPPNYGQPEPGSSVGQDMVFIVPWGGYCYGMDMVAKKLTRHYHQNATAVFEDVVTDYVYVVVANTIRPLFGGSTHQVGRWRSGKASLGSNQPLAWIRVFSDFDRSNPVVVKWYGDGILRHRAVFTSNEPQRLPPGRYLEHEIEVIGQQRVTQVMLASTSEELRSV